ncbi:MAG: hypothetical protein WCF06_14265 [Nitrososphaeraceae archaeon]
MSSQRHKQRALLKMKRRKKPWAEHEKQHKIGLKKDGNGSKLKLDQLRKLPKIKCMN